MPTILIVSASPVDQDRLRLSAEIKNIRSALQRSKNREEWTIESNEAVTVDDLRRSLLDYKPTIVHFSGHGGGDLGLCFEDTNGKTNTATAESLASLFHHFKDSLKCVVLNACYSNVQAETICEEIDYVIGMKSAVNDDSASHFAVSFYDAIFAGTGFRTAFDLGCTALDLNRLPDSNAPVFMVGSHITPQKLTYSSLVPEVESFLYTYLNTPFIERAKFTTTGDSLKPIIQKHYGEQIHQNISKVSVLGMHQISDDQWKVKIKGSQDMYLKVTERNVMLEWEATVGLWEIPVRTYLAIGSNSAIVARVEAELGTYYNYYFKEHESKFQSINIKAIGGIGGFLNGYVKCGSEEYKELIDILYDGNIHKITLELTQMTNKKDMPLITKVLSTNWIYSGRNNLLS